MAESLQDQLRKLGLVDEKKAKRAAQSKRTTQRKKARQAKQQSREARAEARRDEPASRQAARIVLSTQAERDRARERARRRGEERAALRAQIRQIIAKRKKDRAAGEISFSFIDGKKVRSLYVTAELREGLARGSLEIVRLGEGFEVVDRDVAERIRALDPKIVVDRRDTRLDEAEAAYAEHPIPDDLDW